MMQRIASVHLANWSVDLLRRKVETSKRRNVERRQCDVSTFHPFDVSSRRRTEVSKSQNVSAKHFDVSTFGRFDVSPILLIEETRGQQLVARCCENASSAGIEPGMTLAHARALLSVPEDHIHIETIHPERDRARLRALGAWAMRYSPIVAVDPSGDGLFLDITGCERLFGGEERLIRRMAREIHSLDFRGGFRANIAIASTIGCAWAVSRFGSAPTSITLPGDEREAIATLPVRGLRIDEEIVEALREVDLEWIGQVLEVPRAQLVRRFGMELITRIDQALGHARECLQPLRYRPPMLVQRDFDGPTTQTEAIRIAMRELLTELCEALRRRESGTSELLMKLLRVDAPPVEVMFKLAHPSRSAQHLWSLILPKLESAQLGFGVDGILLHAMKTAHIAHEQAEAVEPDHAEVNNEDASLGELLDTLISRCGAERVLRFDSVEAYVPEHAYLARPATAAPRLAARRRRSDSRERIARPSITRPSILLSRPEHVFVTTDEAGEPVRIRHNNEDRAIIRSIGPERLSPEWWHPAGPSQSTRDYYRAQDEAGRWIWIYKQCNDSRWYLHGHWA